MATFIWTWNPTQWSWEDNGYAAAIASTEKGHIVNGRWSVGGRKYGIEFGDSVLMLRQHDHRGLVAGGLAAGEIYDDEHWDGSGQLTRYCDVDYDYILGPDDGLPVEELKREVPEVPWDRLQGSGIRVPEAAEERLEELWSEHLKGLGRVRSESGLLDEDEIIAEITNGEAGTYFVVPDNSSVETLAVWFVPSEVSNVRDSRVTRLDNGLDLAGTLRLIIDHLEVV